MASFFLANVLCIIVASVLFLVHRVDVNALSFPEGSADSIARSLSLGKRCADHGKGLAS
jgi:hypothetical protein